MIGLGNHCDKYFQDLYTNYTETLVALLISPALQERFRPLVPVCVAIIYNMSVASRCGGNVEMCCKMPTCYVRIGYYIGFMELDLPVLYVF